MFPSIQSPLIDIAVYSTKNLLILTGYDQRDTSYRIIEVSRPDCCSESDLSVRQLAARKRVEVDSYLKELSEATTLETIAKDVALVFGLIRLLDNNYMILVTKKRKCASLHGHDIYTIAETQLVSVSYRPKTYKPGSEETRYKAILQQTDLTKNFYFSYTYDLTDTMQNNFHASITAGVENPSKAIRDMFVWNNFALKPLLSIIDQSQEDSHLWVVPVIHGYLKQKTILLDTGHTVKYCLVARRSRMFAGTRYLRRGVNVDGYVANEVESEQIFTREGNAYGLADRSSSIVQIRGSIPLFWSNTSVYAAKPDIKIEGEDPEREATRAHLMHLVNRYGGIVTFLNLVRQKEKKAKESLLSSALMDAFCLFSEPAPTTERKGPVPLDPSYSKASFLSQLNHEGVNKYPINYCCYDFLNADHDLLFADLEKICEGAFPGSGFFVQPPVRRYDREEYIEFPLVGSKARYSEILMSPTDAFKLPSRSSSSNDDDDDDEPLDTAGIGLGFLMGLVQVGVFRTNCIDCLDRTNVGMFVYAKTASFRQLRALGIELSPSGYSNILNLMTQVWAEHGDTIATQYAGSGAMHRLDASSGGGGNTGVNGTETEIKVVGGVGNAVVAARRYYSNVSTDFHRQQSFDLLLGIYEPHMHNDNIWVLKENLEDKRSGKGRRASDALSLRPSVLSTSASSGPGGGNERSIQSEEERLIEQKIVSAALIETSEELKSVRIACRLEKRASNNSFYRDAHQRTLFLDRFEDHQYECDTISIDHVSWKPYTTKLVNVGGRNRYYGQYIPGRVEQDLYFGRREGSTSQEMMYEKYVSLVNIPLYSPSSTIFDENSYLMDKLMATGLLHHLSKLLPTRDLQCGGIDGSNGSSSAQLQPLPVFHTTSREEASLTGGVAKTTGTNRVTGYDGSDDGISADMSDTGQHTAGGMSSRLGSLFSFRGKKA